LWKDAVGAYVECGGAAAEGLMFWSGGFGVVMLM